jgi:spermidine synthase
MSGSWQNSWRLAVVLFFASGLSSLIYQVLWMHLLVLVFGGTTLATSTVLAVFMGGLALGSFIASKFTDRTSNPFLWYGWLEGAIGIWAVLAPALFALATPLYQFAYQSCPNIAALNLVRFGVACVILLPPTICMGATLPLLSKMVTTRLESLGSRVGLLYSVNTAGAVAGTVLAGFVLMPGMGLTATMTVAVAVNVGLALTVMFANKKLGPPAESQDATAQHQPRSTEPPGSIERRTAAIVVLFGISGGASMVYEVGWTRALSLVVGSTTYSFSTMLVAFLLGILLGSYACSRVIDRLPDTVSGFAILELLAGFAAILGLVLFGFVPYWNVWLNAECYQYPMFSMVIRFLLCGLILMPLTFCIGATFPAVVKACTAQLERVGRSVGSVYAANTVGAIFGACLAGFYLIPTLGSERTLVVASVTNIAIGAALLFLVPSIRMPIRVLAGVVALLLVLGFGRLPDLWDKLVLVLSQLQRREFLIGERFQPQSYAEWAAALRSRFQLNFYRDGASSNVAVVQSKETGQVSLLTNGHFDASSGVDMDVQVLLACLPLWCHPGAKQAAVVGWGSGVTVGEAGMFPVEHIDAIELEPAVVVAARYFDATNHRPEGNSRINIIANDGRNYLLGTDKKYDVIVSEPSNPWQSGVCNLFTREYFSICRKRLNEGGIMSLWLQIVEVSPDGIKEIAAALASEFPNTLMFLADDGNLVILASDKPIKIDYMNLVQSVRRGELSNDLLRTDIRSPVEVLGRILASDDGLRALCKSTPPNTDDRNRVEYAVARTYENYQYRDANRAMLMPHIGDADKAVLWPASPPAELSDLKARVAAAAARRGNWRGAEYWVAAAMAAGKSAEAYRMHGLIAGRNGDLKTAQADWQNALALEPANAAVFSTRAEQQVASGDIVGARTDYERALQLNPTDKATRYSLARLYAPTYLCPSFNQPASQPEKVLAVLGSLMEDRKFIEEQPYVLFLTADTLFRLGKYNEAKAMCTRYRSLVPNVFPAAYLMMLIETRLGHTEAASEWRTIELAEARLPTGVARLVQRARVLIARGKSSEAADLLTVVNYFDPENEEAKSLLKSLPH